MSFPKGFLWGGATGKGPAVADALTGGDGRRGIPRRFICELADGTRKEFRLRRHGRRRQRGPLAQPQGLLLLHAEGLQVQRRRPRLGVFAGRKVKETGIG